MTIFQIAWTLIALTFFVGVVVWAYSSKQKERFAEAARLPLDDDEDSGSTSKRENSNG